MTQKEPTLRDVIAPIVRAIVAESKSDVIMVSQRNVESILGITARMHLEYCRRPDFTPKVVRAGKLRLVDAADYRLWLRSMDLRQQETSDAESADGASDVLAELGLHERFVPRKTKSTTANPSKAEGR